MRCPTRQKCDNNVMADFLAQIEFFTEKFLYFYSSSTRYVPKNIWLDIPVGIYASL